MNPEFFLQHLQLLIRMDHENIGSIFKLYVNPGFCASTELEEIMIRLKNNIETKIWPFIIIKPQ
jgi:hypothetical protein